MDSEIFLARALKKDREYLYAHPEKKLTNRQRAEFLRSIERRKKGEPVAYITGHKEFYGLDFKVNHNVLIPRPETEQLVELAIDRIKKKRAAPSVRDSRFKIHDLGVGSGCIAVSIARFLKENADAADFRITASDISAKALKVAKINANKHNARIKFVRSDLFNDLKGKYDMVAANLPYIPAKKLKNAGAGEKKTSRGLAFEPASALTDGTNKWILFKRFFEEIPRRLKNNYSILLEIEPGSKEYIKKLAEKHLPEAKVKFYRDYGQLWRYAEITPSSRPHRLRRSHAGGQGAGMTKKGEKNCPDA